MCTQPSGEIETYYGPDSENAHEKRVQNNENAVKGQDGFDYDGEPIETTSSFPPAPIAPSHTRGDPEEDENDFPEGGARAWLVVLGSWCAMITTFGITNTAGSLQAYIETHQLDGMSSGKVSWIFSIYLFFFFFGGVQVGPVFDTYGLKFVMLPGCVGVVASLFVLSVCKEYYQFVLGFGVLGGIASSLVFTPAVTVIGHWFLKRRGVATGIAATGGAVGGIVFPLSLNKMYDSIGYGWAVRVIAFVCLALCVVACLTTRTRLPPNTKKGAAIDLRALAEPRYALTTLGVFMIEWGIFVPVQYITSYALSHGMDSSLSYQILAILNAVSVLGRALPGYLADRFGRFNVMIFTTVMCGVFSLGLWLPSGNNEGAIISFAALFGFWSGTGICLTPVCVSQVCKTEDYGKRYGTTYFLASFAALTGLPIAGAIQTHQGGNNYSGLIIFGAVAYFVGAAAFAAARATAVGWSPFHKY